MGKLRGVGWVVGIIVQAVVWGGLVTLIVESVRRRRRRRIERSRG